MIIKCAICGKDFSIHPNEHGKRKHCSRKCFHKSRLGHIPWNRGLRYAKPKPIKTKICRLCGGSFTPVHNNRLYCDNCRFTALSGSNRLRQLKYRIKNRDLLNAKPRNPIYKVEYDDKIRFGGQRKIALARDNYKCQFQGCLKTKSLIMHHKNIDDSDNRLENLITLCRQHHMQLHGILEALKPLIF